MDKISIIVPCYNAEKWIEETLQSLMNQTYSNLEILVVDDGSTDDSCKVVQSLLNKDDRVKLITKQNGGVSDTRNIGIEKATGEYVAFIDADDWVELDAYEKMLKKIKSENADIVFCGFTRFFPTKGTKLEHKETSFSVLEKNPHNYHPFFYSTSSTREGDVLYTKDIHGACWRSLFKRDILIEKNIRFHTDLRFAEDQIFVLEYLSVIKKVSYVDESLLWYRANTKKWVYHNLYENDMNLLRYQIAIVNNNPYYSKKQKRKLIGYLRCSTYFMIINEEYMFKPDVANVMRKYTKNKEFRSLLTMYSFWQKFKVKPEFKRIILFALLKLRMWSVVKKFYKNKKY